MEEYKLPKPINHVSFIMDGNGRWAKKRGLPRTAGHLEGCKRIIDIFECMQEFNIKVFTLYAFSTENWNRPKSEITLLFKYLDDFFKKYIDKFIKDGVRVQHMGDMTPLPEKTKKTLIDAIERTKDNDKWVFNICLNYGSRQEITKATRLIAQDVKDGKLNIEDITPELFYKRLDSGNLPECDLLIRTSGEQRLSNFLLYQMAYTEFVFTPTYWPDFKREQFIECLKEYCSRDRRFGAIKE